MNDENSPESQSVETPESITKQASIEPTIDTSQSSIQESTSMPISIEEPTATDSISQIITSQPIQTTSTEFAPAPQTSPTAQTQSLAQQDEHGFIKSLLIKAQAKIQFNKQKKLDKLVQLAQKRGTITNDDVQKLLRVSDSTATRYLVKLVEQGRLARVGSPRDAKYQFVR